ncbi:MAG: HEAT repeat domain-containing protein [Cyanobacteria bacterium SID2]|nr:HEAT repeat domain-containing protein [Cyanobacteria bacterium SID2]MBP0005859.1 HEAT repeat domain-containing protein [Cyanobacteria bacterium SBC]
MPVEVLIEAVDRADSADDLLAAVEDLADSCDETAIPTLIQVLGFNNPGAAVAAVDGLSRIGKPAVLPLLEQLDGYNYGARAWAIRALSQIGDPRAFEILVTAAVDFSLSVRRAAVKGLGSLQWEELEIEDRSSFQQKAREILLQTTSDPEWVVRYSTIVGLEILSRNLTTTDARAVRSIEIRLQEIEREDTEIAVRARAALARQRLVRER